MTVLPRCRATDLRVEIRLATELLAARASRPFWSGAPAAMWSSVREPDARHASPPVSWPGGWYRGGSSRSAREQRRGTRYQNAIHAVLHTLLCHCLVGSRRASWRGLARDVGVVRQHHRHVHHEGWAVASCAHAYQVGAWRDSGGVGASFRRQQIRHRRLVEARTGCCVGGAPHGGSPRAAASGAKSGGHRRKTVSSWQESSQACRRHLCIHCQLLVSKNSPAQLSVRWSHTALDPHRLLPTRPYHRVECVRAHVQL